MAKKWKLVRAMLAAEGYTTVASAEGVTLDSIDADGLIHWTDADGNAHESYYDGESVATTITIGGVITPMQYNYTAATGSTATLSATNDMGDTITDDVTFSSDDETVISVSGNVLTAEATGTTFITATDGDVSTDSPTITVEEV